MSHEVDVLAVGDESRSGEAIAIRFGKFLENPADQVVIVIDGGFQESGRKIVERITHEYGTDTVDLVISTHPDNDHISGLKVVLEDLNVKELWMHRPWLRSDSLKQMAVNRSILSSVGLTTKLKKSLEAAYDLEQIAISRGIPIKEPFEGQSAFNGAVHILGPSPEYYTGLIEEMKKIGFTTAVGIQSLERVINQINEVWHQDGLQDPADDAVKPRNNSSVITLLQLGEDHFLFTGDAGVPALTHAVNYASANNYSIAANVTYQHIPHHGSKRNLGPTLLDTLVGPKRALGETIKKRAFISSAAKGLPKHPSGRVQNALIRRGVEVTATQGQDHYFRSLDLPMRENWGPITPLTFLNSYED